MSMEKTYTIGEIIGGVVAGLFTLTIVLIPIIKSIRTARNWRKFEAWRKEHGLPFYGELEEETGKGLWNVY